MRFSVLLLMAGFSSTLLAQDDPFAPYHRVIEEQLLGMSEAGNAVPRKTLEIPAPPESKIAREIPIADFALKFWGGRDAHAAAALLRLEGYRPTLEGILEREGVPKSLIAVVLVESGAQPLAISPKQARGLWQFMPATARQYGLTVTSAKDERVEVEPSTRAAARYLRDLHKTFGDWPLALAAYNAGAETVQRALQRGHATTFSQISAAQLLPEETRNYVPAILSAIELLGTDGLVEPQPTAKEQSIRILYAPAAITN